MGKFRKIAMRGVALPILVGTSGRAAHTGNENVLTNPEGLLNRVLEPSRPGRKPKKQEKVGIVSPDLSAVATGNRMEIALIARQATGGYPLGLFAECAHDRSCP